MRWPAEWEPHEAVWIGFPGDPAEWPVGLASAQQEVAAFANAVCDEGRGEKVFLICRSPTDAGTAKNLVNSNVEIVHRPFGDIWLRDTAPFMTDGDDGRRAHIFRFNGWGRKFEMAGDEDIGLRLCQDQNIAFTRHDMILEGGAVDGNGAGLLLTTKQCVLNTNRNTNHSQEQFEYRMRKALGAEKICWLSEGLVNDHTDGHVDNLARFVASGTVAVPKADCADDPNSEIFEDATRRCEQFGLDVVRLPSVGEYLIDGNIAPASYANFYIGNKVVVVPQFQASNDSDAMEAIQELFPGRQIVGCSSQALLRGGGSFHCISQQIPMASQAVTE